MLIEFRVENHRSIRDEQTLSLVAADEQPEGAHVLRKPGLAEGLLPVVALYGANASGKSNVLQAMAFARAAVMESQRLWDPEGGVPAEPFALTDEGTQPSTYELILEMDGQRYEYGFELTRDEIRREWLSTWTAGESDAVSLFDREGKVIELGNGLRALNPSIRSLTRNNSLFLSAAAQHGDPTLLGLYRWFRRMAVRVGPNRRSSVRKLRGVPVSGAREPSDAVVRLLRAADVGILEVRREEPGSELRVRHEGGGWLPLAWESAGTIALLRLADAILEALRTGMPLVVDELEANLHPSVALEIVRLFNEPEQNPRGAQLIFSTHDTNLLGSIPGGTAPLRRDQIWFTEKDGAGATELYPLTDFHSRGPENLERGYLQGRYGAVPFLGAFAKSARPLHQVADEPIASE